MASLLKLLLQIEESKSYDQLNALGHPGIWNTLSQEERFQLARLLVLQGTHQLAQGNQKVIETFARASEVAGDNPDILLQQARAYASHQDNFRCLQLAISILENCLHKNPHLLHGWFLLGKVKTESAQFENDMALLYEANECFEKGANLLDSDNTLEEAFYWQWGLCLYTLGRIVGEPCELHKANEKFQLAYAIGFRNPEFLNQYGQSCHLLFYLLDQIDYLKEGLHLFNESLLSDITFADAWLNRACAYKEMVLLDSSEHNREEAEHSFVTASELNPDHPQVWTEWAIYETVLGKIDFDPAKMESAQKKFEQAEIIDPHFSHPLSLNAWAEANLFLGEEEESLLQLNEAKAKIIKSLEICPTDPESWHLYGTCLNVIGNYFSDENYFYQAIEKFKYGLTLTQDTGRLYYGIALSHYYIAEISEDALSYERAIHYFSLALDSGSPPSPQYWNDYAATLMKLGDLSENHAYVEMALEKFDKIFQCSPFDIQLDNDNLEWVLNLASAYLLFGELTENLHHIEKTVHLSFLIVQFDPSYVQARYQLAVSLAALGEITHEVECYQRAVEQFQFILELNPEDDVVHVDLGTTFIHLGLLMQDPLHPEQIQYYLRNAERHFVHAASLGNGPANYLLTGVYSLLQQFDQAMYYLERAGKLEVLPDIEDLLHDDWLESLRSTSAFRLFIDDLSSQHP